MLETNLRYNNGQLWNTFTETNDRDDDDNAWINSSDLSYYTANVSGMLLPRPMRKVVTTSNNDSKLVHTPTTAPKTCNEWP